MQISNKLILKFFLFLPLMLFAVSSFGENVVFNDNLYDVKITGDGVYAVGYYGTILHSQDRGNSWEVQKSNTLESLFALDLYGINKAWAVGSRGAIICTNDGKTWELQASHTDKHLFDVFFLDEKKGFACGIEGTILSTEDGGKIWEDRSVKKDLGFYSLFFTDENTGWAVGEFGVIYQTEDGGITWTKQKSPVEISPVSGESQCLFKIHFKNKSSGYIVGMDGGILKTEDGGKSWQIVPKVVEGHLFDLSEGNENLLSVGIRGAVVAINSDPSPVDLGVRKDLNGICLGNKGLAFIVGNNGTILRSFDGGKNWKLIEMNAGVENE